MPEKKNSVEQIASTLESLSSFSLSMCETFDELPNSLYLQESVNEKDNIPMSTADELSTIDNEIMSENECKNFRRNVKL